MPLVMPRTDVRLNDRLDRVVLRALRKKHGRHKHLRRAQGNGCVLYAPYLAHLIDATGDGYAGYIEQWHALVLRKPHVAEHLEAIVAAGGIEALRDALNRPGERFTMELRAQAARLGLVDGGCQETSPLGEAILRALDAANAPVTSAVRVGQPHEQRLWLMLPPYVLAARDALDKTGTLGPFTDAMTRVVRAVVDGVSPEVMREVILLGGVGAGLALANAT